MSRQEQTNTFQDGIMTDMHPLSANNTTMTDAKNATIITYNGNEMILQNDMGNSKIKVSKDSDDYVKLTEGFKPLGVVEHGGILYIASTDGTNFELGSFPGPEFDDPKEEYIGQLTDESFSEEGIINNSNKAPIVKPNTTTFEECFLDRILQLYYINGDKKEPVTLSAGQNFIIDVLSYHTLTKDDDNNDKKKFYKIRFINIDNGQDITDLLKFAINYTTNIDPNSSIDKYFPNIINVKLGVKFELEDIEFFDLGVTTELEDSKIPHKDYNGGRFPYLQITNEGNYAIFQRIEFKTNSEIKVNFVDIDWKLISKSAENNDVGKELSGSFRQRLGNPNDDKYELEDMIIEIPNNLNWYLEYTIYPQWKNLPSSKNLFTREHQDYNKTLGKYKKHNIIDLSLNPSLWGATEEYSDDNEDFKIHRYLSRDLFLSGMEGSDQFRLGLSIKDEQETYFDFIEAHQEKGYTFTIDESKKEDSIEYVGCLNEKSQDFTEVFPSVDENQYRWNIVWGYMSHFHDAPLGLYKATVGIIPSTSREGLIYEQKKCKIHNFIHRNYIKSKELNYTKFYNVQIGKCYKSVNGFLQAEKHSPYILYDYYNQNYSTLSHIEKDKIALSPLQQKQELCIYYQQSSHDDQNVLSSWKKLSCPIAGASDTMSGDRVTAHFGRYGKYNSNIVSGSKEAWAYYNEYYENKSENQDIELKDGSMNLNIQTNFLCLVGKQEKENHRSSYKPEWLEDINQDVTEVSSLFQNSKICQYNQKPKHIKSGEPERVRWDEVNKDNNDKNIIEPPEDNGGYVNWKYTFNIDKSYISIDNDLKQYIQLALKKSRIYNGSRVPVDNFDNLIQNIDFSQGIKPNNEKDNFTKSENRTSFNIRNQISRDECFSSVGIIAPYSINDGYYATFLEFGNHYNKEFTINFNKQNTKYYNIRFYLKCSQNKGIEIETNLEEQKIYTQSTNSDYEEVEKLAYNGLDQFILVQIIGKCSEDPYITFKYANTGNSSDYNSCIVRNIHLYLQETSDPFKTYAITTYYDDRVLVDCKQFVNDYMYNIGGGGKNYCYLPDPDYLISITTPVFKCDDQGVLNLNNKEYNIIT